jgi:CPA2 family monovalent cation:H+ antiporter-2
MLFDPGFILREPLLVMACLSIVLIAKPLIAVTIVALLGYPARTGIIVALGLAQIGEFSFILSELGRSHGLLTDAGHNVLVACAIVSITLNPLLVRSAGVVERFLERRPSIWRLINRGVRHREQQLNDKVTTMLAEKESPLAVILGYAPVGRVVDDVIRSSGLETIIIDLNMDTVQELTRKGRLAIYGDANNVEVMAAAMPRATHLIISLPHTANRTPLIATAKLINPATKIFVRAHYIRERDELMQVGADQVCYEEAEAAVALAKLVLADRGADAESVKSEMTRIRQGFMKQVSA